MTAPMVRARVVEYLAGHVVPGIRRYNGQVPVTVDIQRMASDLGISPHDANETMWHLQKQQVVTFKERKGPKGSVISQIRLADTALLKQPVETIAKAVATNGEVLDQAIDIVSVAADITDEQVKSYPNTPCKNRVVSPEWCVEHDSMWPRGDQHCAAEWDRRTEPAVAGASSQNLDAATTTPGEATSGADDLPVILVPPSIVDFPQIQGVIAKALRIRALTLAVELLSDSGQDDVAMQVLQASENLTLLDGEVLALAQTLGWMDENGQPT